MRDRFHYTEVGLYGRLYEVLAVAGDGAADYLYPAFGKFINFRKLFDDYVDGLAVVRLIVRIEYAAVGGDEYEFCGRGAAVYAEVSLARISGDVGKGQIGGAVTLYERRVLLLVLEERFARDNLVGALGVLYAGDELLDRHGLYACRVERRAYRHEAGRIVGEHRILFGELERAYERLPQAI